MIPSKLAEFLRVEGSHTPLSCLAVSDLLESFFVGWVCGQDRSEVGARFFIHAQHHLGHCQIVPNGQVIGILGAQILKRDK